MMAFLLRAVIAALGLWAGTRIVPGLRIDDAQTLLWAAFLLGIANATVRPVLLLLTLPLSLLTLGLFIFVINAGMLAGVAALLEGFHLSGFGAAFWGAIVVGLASLIGSWLFNPRGGIHISVRRQ